METALTIATVLGFCLTFFAVGMASHAITRLRNLRRNCFLTNEKGHRVRYADASVEVRARAEGSN